MRSTIQETIELSGVGLHSGDRVNVRLCPSDSGEGIYFARVDRTSVPLIPALVESVAETTLSTELVAGEGKVRTVEHLLAALTGCGVSEARIEIDGGEVPLLDGSALDWIEAIDRAGITSIDSGSAPVLSAPVTVYEGDMFVSAIPSPELRFTYGVDFPYGPIGKQWHSWSPAEEDFRVAIAPARTFGFADQIEYLQKAGLIKGGSLENALVCDKEKWLNPPLRFENEPVRHKLLDLIGDLTLLGTIPTAHYIAYKASHKLHVQLARAIRG
ncbi:UDP-3-O-acyl-N-acetylglucosamine deacetylase [Pannus brasiliensis CCIBt3594]|uniref:UDP-3-O-acyl-N-acetylglucosamine deacetylase n=1 Tax=Pannus brasiliensis CCIBt3594 TaxID=1427578 RepID=A0AAW9QHR8_9CHRO